MQETQERWFRFLGREDAWAEGMATLSSILAGESHGLRSLATGHGAAKSQTGQHTHTEAVISESANWSSTLGVLLICHNLLYCSFSDD